MTVEVQSRLSSGKLWWCVRGPHACGCRRKRCPHDASPEAVFRSGRNESICCSRKRRDSPLVWKSLFAKCSVWRFHWNQLFFLDLLCVMMLTVKILFWQWCCKLGCGISALCDITMGQKKIILSMASCRVLFFVVVVVLVWSMDLKTFSVYEFFSAAVPQMATEKIATQPHWPSCSQFLKHVHGEVRRKHHLNYAS